MNEENEEVIKSHGGLKKSARARLVLIVLTFQIVLLHVHGIKHVLFWLVLDAMLFVCQCTIYVDK